MAILVTENWSGRRLSLAWPWTASREFVVTGTTSETEVLEAVNDTIAIPKADDEHPENSRLICRGPQIGERKGPSWFVVRCDYDCPESGSNASPGGDPLKQSPTIEWQKVTVSEMMDRDLDNHPILNSAGKPLDPMSMTIGMRRLVITKNFPYYNMTLSNTYEDAVNSAQITLADGITIKAQHMLCEEIIPASSYTPKAKYIPMRFAFLVCAHDLLGDYPFQYRVLDQGTEGWYSDGGTRRDAKFSDGRDPPTLVEQPVRFDGTGKPLSVNFAHVRVGKGNATALGPSTATDTYAKEYYDSTGTKLTMVGDVVPLFTAAVFLVYKRAKIVDFAPLTELL